MTPVSYATSDWHADGLRWIAGLLTRAADALESHEAPAELQPPSASAACDEARSRGAYRAPLY